MPGPRGRLGPRPGGGLRFHLPRQVTGPSRPSSPLATARGNDQFGYSVAISGGTALVGAYNHEVGSNTWQGAAYVFTDSGSTWSQQAELTATDGAAYDLFGCSVSLSGATALVGAPTTRSARTLSRARHMSSPTRGVHGPSRPSSPPPTVPSATSSAVRSRFRRPPPWSAPRTTGRLERRPRRGLRFHRRGTVHGPSRPSSPPPTAPATTSSVPRCPSPAPPP